MTSETDGGGRTERPRRLPGDLDHDALIDRIVRVDHAGEFGAQRIYEGQLAVLARHPSAKTIRHMKEQEDRHPAAFEALIRSRRVRPTILHRSEERCVGTACGPSGSIQAVAAP